MNDDDRLNQDISDKLIMRLLHEIKKSTKDRNGNDYKLSERFKKILEEEVK
jgi:hypothetical protein